MSELVGYYFPTYKWGILCKTHTTSTYPVWNDIIFSFIFSIYPAPNYEKPTKKISSAVLKTCT